jgi:hypothetical protein
MEEAIKFKPLSIFRTPALPLSWIVESRSCSDEMPRRIHEIGRDRLAQMITCNWTSRRLLRLAFVEISQITQSASRTGSRIGQLSAKVNRPEQATPPPPVGACHLVPGTALGLWTLVPVRRMQREPHACCAAGPIGRGTAIEDCRVCES